jgi:hypothetical protein
LETLQKVIAEDNGILLYKKYSEAEAAAFLDLHPKTLKDIRLAGRIGCVRMSARKISYLGVHIADYMIGGIKWAEDQSHSIVLGNTGSQAGMGLISSTDTGTMKSEKSRVAHRSALQILKQPRTN